MLLLSVCMHLCVYMCIHVWCVCLHVCAHLCALGGICVCVFHKYAVSPTHITKKRHGTEGPM